MGGGLWLLVMCSMPCQVLLLVWVEHLLLLQL
jgi:hypothetical protein